MSLFRSLLFILIISPGALVAQITQEQRQFDEVERFYTYAARTKDRNEQVRFMRHSIPLYEKYLWAHPYSKNAAMGRFHLGHAQQTLGQLENATRSYELVIQRHQKGRWVGASARQLAYLNFANKEFAKAAHFFGLTASHIGDESLRQTALTKQAQCLIKVGDHRAASSVLGSIARDPNHRFREWAIFKQGEILFEEEEYKRSIEVFRPLVDGAATDAYRTLALFYTGLCAAELGDGELAETYLRAVLDTPHNSPSLEKEDRRRIAHNKSMAQNSLMGMYLRAKDYQEVINLYRLGDFGARGKLEARRSMRAGRAFYILKKYDQARTAFRRVDRAVPNTTLAFEASFKCLECDYQLKHPGLAPRVDVFLELYEKRQGDDVKVQTALFLKAQTLFNNADYEKAAKAFNAVQPGFLPTEYRAGLLYKKGFVLAETGDFNGATRSLSFFLKDFPDDSRALDAISIRGEAYERLGDRASALRDFNELLNAENCPPEIRVFALQRSARILKEEKQYKAMVKNYRSMLGEFSNLPKDTESNANYWIGWGYFKMRQNAVPYLEKALEMVPEFYAEAAGKALVLVHFAEGDAKQMHKALSALLDLKPNKIIPKHMLTWLGAQMFHQGSFFEASTYLERATDPQRVLQKDLAIWRMLAKTQNEARLYADALISAKIALSLETEDRWKADTKLDIAMAYLGLGQSESAEQAARQGLALNVRGPHTAGLHLVLGEIAYTKEHYEKAYEEAISAIRIALDDPFVKPRALHLAGNAAEQLGSNAEAARYRRQLKRNFPSWIPPKKAENSTQTAKP